MLFRPNNKTPSFSSEYFVNVNVARGFYFYFFLCCSAGSAGNKAFCSSTQGTDRQFTFLSIHFLYLKNKKKLRQQLFWNGDTDEKPGILCTCMVFRQKVTLPQGELFRHVTQKQIHHHSHFKCLFSMLAWATVDRFLNGFSTNVQYGLILCQTTLSSLHLSTWPNHLNLPLLMQFLMLLMLLLSPSLLIGC